MSAGTELVTERVTLTLAIEKPLASLDADDDRVLFARGSTQIASTESVVRDILQSVRTDGDAALVALARRYDRVELESLEVPRELWVDALESLDSAVRSALEEAAAAIARFHTAQLPKPLEIETHPGVRIGRHFEPLGRVGVYAPGGRASYPSSVLMGVVPARAARVGEVIVCSPPGVDGLTSAAVRAACAIAGADRLFAIGGAGAVGALAYGTESVPAVQRIVGPGNAYVNEAKRQVAGIVGIDSPAGPSELLILADATADAETCAAELLAQAEHDPDAAVVLVTTSAAVAMETRAALQRLCSRSPRQGIVRESLRTGGAILRADSRAAMLEFARRYAPEHLLLLVEQPRAALEEVRCAGTVFLGPFSSVAFGDYTTGANHVLPTGGRARAYSGLSTLDFGRFCTYQEVDAAGAAALAGLTATLAEAEGLPGHAYAARLAPLSRAAGGSSPQFRREREQSSGVVLRAAYSAVELYDPRRVAAEVDLSDNTNLFGVAPAAARALAALRPPVVSRYPAVYADRLKRALAELLGVDAENVVTGCGSDDVIDSALRAFLDPGDVFAFATPTFGIVPSFGAMNAARNLAVPLLPGFALDADALLATRARVTYLCRPNNPTGNEFDRADTERVSRGAAGVVLIDEAYADFADDPLAQWAASSDRTVVIRTLSKAWSLAGLRVGFAIGPAELVREIEKSRGPYKVSGPAEEAALAALREDRGWVQERIAEVRANRERLKQELEARGDSVWPSTANFLLVAAPAGARAMADLLRESGVQVRAFPELPFAGDCIRVTVGPWPLMERFLAVYDAVSRRIGAESLA